MKKFAIAVPVVLILSLAGIVTGCGSSSSSKPSTTVPATNGQGVPNYANSSNWLSLPAKATKKVDVFYLGDTTYQKPNASAPNICAINDAQMQAGAKAKFSASATAFETIANIYSPYYRQADASVLLLPHDQQSAIIAGIPTHDGLSAFDYYQSTSTRAPVHACRTLAGIERYHQPDGPVHEEEPRRLQADDRRVRHRVFDHTRLPGAEPGAEVRRRAGRHGSHQSPTTLAPDAQDANPSYCPARWPSTRSRGPEPRQWPRPRRTSGASPSTPRPAMRLWMLRVTL